MIASIDHIVILVDDLAQAGATYAALGFTVSPGGEHIGGATHNLLVSFADGTYLELLAFKRTMPEHRWSRHVVGGPGLIDFALLPTTIEADIVAARQRNLAISDPLAGGRLRPDGVQLEWQSATAEAAELPFLCGDVTPRELRVPGGAATQHANGVAGIAELVVSVNDLVASVGRYEALLGSPPSSAENVARFRLGESQIALHSPGSAERVARRGPGISALRFIGGSIGGISWEGQLIERM